MSTLSPLPNPTTPLAWLPADIGAQLQVSGYLFVATLGAWGWDLLMAFPEEYHILVNRKFGFSQAVYIIARLFSLAYIVMATVFQIADVSDCNAMIVAIGAVGTIAVPANSFVMFLRVKAVYAQNRPVVYTFTFLWLATLAGCFTAPFSLKGIHIGTTNRCIDSEVKAYGSAGIVVSAVNDTLIFAAITYRLIFHHILGESWSSRIHSFVKGDGMGKVSKLLLQTGQIYYLATAGMNILTVVSILAPAFPPVLHAMFTVPNIALTNAMACRVYRQVRLGLLLEKPITQMTQQSAPIQLLPTTGSRAFTRSAHNEDIESIAHRHMSNKAAMVAVHIQQETDIHSGDTYCDPPASPPLKPAGLDP